MAGRKPKPTAVKKLEGNPGKRKLNSKEPVPAKGIPACPAWLMPEAKKEWERLAELMNQMGVLTEVDIAAFAAYCQSYARWKEAQEHITSGGSTFETDKGYQQQTPWVGIANTNQKLMLQAASESGLTPSSRSRIIAGNSKAKEPEFQSIAVYSRMEQLGHFECSDQAVNKLVENSIWSQKSNFCDVPTDCPTRERAAWTGDMGVFAETGIYQEDCYPVIRKWLGECRLNQYEDGKVANIAPRNNIPSFFSKLLAGSVGWGDACIIVPYGLYQRYGDVRILEENYDMMRRWYAYLESRAGQKVMPSFDLAQIPEEYRAMAANMPKEKLAEMMKKFRKTDGKDGTDNTDRTAEENPFAAYAIETGVDYGEWCELDVESTEVMGTPQGKVATAYFARSGRMLAEIAEILGREEDAAGYREIAEKAAEAFRHMATENGRIRSDRQAEYVRAVSFGLLGETEEKQAVADLNALVIENDYHLNTGFLSTPFLCAVLAEGGYVETAYRLLLQDTMPGWLYAVKKGATTIWETWDGHASLNHYSYGAICGWLFSGVCGIRLNQGKITIQPTPHASLKYARASYLSPVGEIVSAWRYEGEKVVYEIEIPSNGEALVLLPDGRQEHLSAGKYCLRMCDNL